MPLERASIAVTSSIAFRPRSSDVILMNAGLAKLIPTNLVYSKTIAPQRPVLLPRTKKIEVFYCPRFIDATFGHHRHTGGGGCFGAQPLRSSPCRRGGSRRDKERAGQHRVFAARNKSFRGRFLLFSPGLLPR